MEVLAEFGVQKQFFFPLIDFGATDFEATPVTFASGDTQRSQDAGAFSNATNNPAHEGNGIYSLTLTAAELQADRIVVTIIDQTSTKEWEDQAIIISTSLGGQIAATKAIIVGTVDTTDFTATTTALEGTRTAPNTTEEATASHMIGKLIAFTSGVALGELTDITAYVLANSKEKYTYTAIVSTPANGDTYVVF